MSAVEDLDAAEDKDKNADVDAVRTLLLEAQGVGEEDNHRTLPLLQPTIHKVGVDVAVDLDVATSPARLSATQIKIAPCLLMLPFIPPLPSASSSKQINPPATRSRALCQSC